MGLGRLASQGLAHIIAGLIGVVKVLHQVITACPTKSCELGTFVVAYALGAFAPPRHRSPAYSFAEQGSWLSWLPWLPCGIDASRIE
jgi:hypothetical protein